MEYSPVSLLFYIIYTLLDIIRTLFVCFTMAALLYFIYLLSSLSEHTTFHTIFSKTFQPICYYQKLTSTVEKVHIYFVLISVSLLPMDHDHVEELENAIQVDCGLKIETFTLFSPFYQYFK